jgi:hypothetical protein
MCILLIFDYLIARKWNFSKRQRMQKAAKKDDFFRIFSEIRDLNFGLKVHKKRL